MARCIAGLLIFYALGTVYVTAQYISSQSLYEDQFACPGNRLVFTCEVQADSQDNLALAWSSEEFIGGGGTQIIFAVAADSVGTIMRKKQDTVANFTGLIERGDGSFSLISTLNVTVSSNLTNTSVSCIDIGTANNATKFFTVLGEPNAPLVVPSQLECMNTRGNIVCVVASTWLYNQITDTQAGVNSFSINVTTVVGLTQIANQLHTMNNNITLRVNDGRCSTDGFVVAVRAINVCGLKGDIGKNFTQRVDNSLATTAPFNNVCDAPIRGAANKDRSLTINVIFAIVSMISILTHC